MKYVIEAEEIVTTRHLNRYKIEADSKKEALSIIEDEEYLDVETLPYGTEILSIENNLDNAVFIENH